MTDFSIRRIPGMFGLGAAGELLWLVDDSLTIWRSARCRIWIGPVMVTWYIKLRGGK